MRTTGGLLRTSRRPVERTVTRVVVSRGLVHRGRTVCLPPFCRSRHKATGGLLRLVGNRNPALFGVRTSVLTVRGTSNVECSRIRVTTVRRTMHSGIVILANNPKAKGAAAARNVVSTCGATKVEVLLTTPANETSGQVDRTANVRTGAVRQLLRFGPRSKCGHGRRGPLRNSTLVISRYSVVSVVLVCGLVGTVPRRVHLILINSVSRLPDIKTKGILHSVVSSRGVPIVQLAHVFQRTRSDQVVVDTRTVGRKCCPSADGNGRASFFFVGGRSPRRITARVIGLMGCHLPGTCGRPRDGVRILAPVREDIMNTTGLGVVLRRTLGASGLKVDHNKAACGLNSHMVRVEGGCSGGMFGNSVKAVRGIGVRSHAVSIDFRSRSTRCRTTRLSRLALTCTAAVRGDRNSRCPVIIVPVLVARFMVLRHGLVCAKVAETGGVYILVNRPGTLTCTMEGLAIDDEGAGLGRQLHNRVRTTAGSSPLRFDGPCILPRRGRPVVTTRPKVGEGR